MKNESTLRETPQKWLWRLAAVRVGGVSPPVLSLKLTISHLNRIQGTSKNHFFEKACFKTA
ncbi:MAG: hypothetical protein NTV46_03235 [Verrucomicrobia bacterium]|nr:hypothetical protein [Verrucomicrobiota bacterium]